MNVKQLNSFVRAAELKSFTKAAKEQNITSPALTSQVNALEKEFGYPLFNRNTHCISLSPQGVIFYKAAREMLAAYYRFEKKCAESSQHNSIVIAASFAQILYLSKFCYCFSRMHPDISVTFSNVEGTEMIDALDKGNVQIGFCPEPSRKILEDKWFIKTGYGRFCILAAENHPLGSRSSLSAEDLKEYVVETWSSPIWKTDPADILRKRGIKTVIHEGPLTTEMVMNAILNDHLVLYPYPNTPEKFLWLKMISIDFYAGNYGFLISRKPDPLVNEFIEQYLS